MGGKAEAYVAFVEDLIRRAGLEPGACYNEDAECWQFEKGSADIFISVIEIAGDYYINVASPIMEAPARNREALFERLLQENAQRIAVKFSLRDDVVWLEINREMNGLTLDEAMRALVRVSEVSDELDEELISRYGDDAEA